MVYTIRADHLFDGLSWHRNATVTIGNGCIQALGLGDDLVDASYDTVTPGLVDGGALCSGYSERPSTHDPYSPERAFALLSLRYGVTDVVEVGSPISVVSSLRELQGGRGPRLWYCGGRLVDTPTSRNDIVVTPKAVCSVVSGLSRLGASFVSAKWSQDRRFTSAVAEAAAEESLPVSWSVTAGRVEIPGWIWTSGSGTVRLEGFSWSGPTQPSAIVPVLESVVRWTIEGLTAAKDGWMAAPVLPYARSFALSRGVVGRHIAKSVLAKLYGDRNPQLVAETRNGVTQSALADGSCLVGSGAGQAGLVPGLSVWHEMRRLNELTDDVTKVLHAATGACRRLGIMTGLVEVSAQANLLCWSSRGVGELDHQGLTDVYVNGSRFSIADLASEVDELVKRSLEEKTI